MRQFFYRIGLSMGLAVKRILRAEPNDVDKGNHDLVLRGVNDISEAVFSVEEIKQKAKNFIAEKNWNFLLIEAYIATKHFGAWSKNGETQARWNFGIGNISTVVRSIDCGYVKDDTEFLLGEIGGISFELGGFERSSSFPDGDSFRTTCVSFSIERNRVMAVIYSEIRADAYFASDYEVSSVEEFHNHPLIDKVLNLFHEGIADIQVRNKLKKTAEMEEKYKGKFSF